MGAFTFNSHNLYKTAYDRKISTYQGLNNKMNCQLILTNKVCAAVLLLWVMEAMFNRILFCCNGNQGTVLRFVEMVSAQ